MCIRDSYNIMGSFALFFLTTIAGVHPAAAGTITAVGSVWNTLCGVVNGYVSDNLQSRAGKRKPFLLAASIPLMLFTSLFFLNIDTSETFKVLYYTVMIILFWTAFSMFFVPYLAWGAELTDDYDERTVLRGYVSFFYCIGSLIGLVLPNILVSWVTAAGYTAAAGWQITGIFCGVVDVYKRQVWYDTLVDSSVPYEMIPENIYDEFNSGDTTLMAVFFDASTSSDESMNAVSEIRKIGGKQCFVSGMTAFVEDLKELAEKEEPVYVAIAVVLCCIVLAIFMDSWIIPLVFIAGIGMSILYNLGSNVFMGQISYITKALSAVLQLGVTMDYSIFLWHSYEAVSYTHLFSRSS